jgi:hypothetical protein
VRGEASGLPSQGASLIKARGPARVRPDLAGTARFLIMACGRAYLRADTNIKLCQFRMRELSCLDPGLAPRCSKAREKRNLKSYASACHCGRAVGKGLLLVYEGIHSGHVADRFPREGCIVAKPHERAYAARRVGLGRHLRPSAGRGRSRGGRFRRGRGGRAGGCGRRHRQTSTDEGDRSQCSGSAEAAAGERLLHLVLFSLRKVLRSTERDGLRSAVAKGTP